jgi:hypothetical protein
MGYELVWAKLLKIGAWPLGRRIKDGIRIGGFRRIL